MSFTISRLGAADVSTARTLLAVFRTAFEEPESDRALEPEDGYIASLLADPKYIALVARDEAGAVVGGLAAYELQKLERARSEIYLYDLAVAEAHRRRGVATALIARLGEIGAAAGAWVIFVQADTVDAPAVALYTKLACLVESEVVHFDIAIAGGASAQA